MSKKRKGSGSSIQSKEESLKDHKGVTNYKGSGYNGKGNVDFGKVTSNKKRR